MEAAALDPPQERDVRTQVIRKLARLYGCRQNEPAFLETVRAAVARAEAGVPSGVLEQLIDGDGSSVAWDLLLQVHRNALADLRGLCGLPCESFVARVARGFDPTGERLLGEDTPAAREIAEPGR